MKEEYRRSCLCQPIRVILGWGGWTRTNTCGSQSPVPYRLGYAPSMWRAISYAPLCITCRAGLYVDNQMRLLSAQAGGSGCTLLAVSLHKERDGMLDNE